MKRIKIMAGNWKMNKSRGELSGFFSEFKLGLKAQAGDLENKLDVIFALPYTMLDSAVGLNKDSGIRIAAQNCHWEAAGAFTGEISLGMLKEVGVHTTLIGHSERRQYFNESDAHVAKKTLACLEAEVTPIVCVGETLSDRDSGVTNDVIRKQVLSVLTALPETRDLIFAYEPVWAIGTGRSATAEQAQEVHQFIRSLIAESVGEGVATSTRIIYGGSANPKNIDSLMAMPDIDGALVGGASLKPDDFASMANAAFSLA